MKSLTNKAQFAALAACIVSPSIGYGFLHTVRKAEEPKPAKSASYGKISPHMTLRGVDIVTFTKHLLHLGNAETKETGLALTNALGTGLDLDFGWKNCVSFKGRTFVGGTQASSTNKTVKAQLFDADARITVFSPINASISFLTSAGWEQKWVCLVDQFAGYASRYTSGILRINGPFAGIGLNVQSSASWSIDTSINYHMPSGVGRIKAPLPGQEGLQGPTWLDKARYRAARFGFSGYLGATWRSSEQWSMTFSMERVALAGKGQHVGEASQVLPEGACDTMSITYTDYGFALNYTF